MISNCSTLRNTGEYSELLKVELKELLGWALCSLSSRLKVYFSDKFFFILLLTVSDRFYTTPLQNKEMV